MTDLEKVTNRNISCPEQMWRELDELAQAWGIPRSVAFRLIYADWKQIRGSEITRQPFPINPQPEAA